MGIKVEIKQGRRGWYVAADFDDGQAPIVKGPMVEADARAMAAELEADAAAEAGVVVRDRSEEEAAANRRAALGFFALVGVLAGAIGFVVTWWLR